MPVALAGKILITIVGGCSISAIYQSIYGTGPFTAREKQEQCRVVRVLPSIATAIRAGTTLIIEEEGYQYTPDLLEPVHAIFKAVGKVKMWPAAKVPIGATLSASSQALFAVLLEAVVDAGVGMGLEREEALELAADGMKGTAGLVIKEGGSGEVVRKIATKGGSTEKGLQILDDEKAKSVLENAVRSCAKAASQLSNLKE